MMFDQLDDLEAEQEARRRARTSEHRAIRNARRRNPARWTIKPEIALLALAAHEAQHCSTAPTRTATADRRHSQTLNRMTAGDRRNAERRDRRAANPDQADALRRSFGTRQPKPLKPAQQDDLFDPAPQGRITFPTGEQKQ